MCCKFKRAFLNLTAPARPCISILAIISPREPVASAAHASPESTWTRITCISLNILIALALAPTLQRFTQFFCERDVSGMRPRVCCLPRSLPEYIYDTPTETRERKIAPPSKSRSLLFFFSAATPILKNAFLCSQGDAVSLPGVVGRSHHHDLDGGPAGAANAHQ